MVRMTPPTSRVVRSQSHVITFSPEEGGYVPTPSASDFLGNNRKGPFREVTREDTITGAPHRTDVYWDTLTASLLTTKGWFDLVYMSLDGRDTTFVFSVYVAG
jgi:hypothetical protein